MVWSIFKAILFFVCLIRFKRAVDTKRRFSDFTTWTNTSQVQIIFIPGKKKAVILKDRKAKLSVFLENSYKTLWTIIKKCKKWKTLLWMFVWNIKWKFLQFRSAFINWKKENSIYWNKMTDIFVYEARYLRRNTKVLKTLLNGRYS